MGSQERSAAELNGITHAGKAKGCGALRRLL